MNRDDIFFLIRADNPEFSDYTPVACLLNSGYGCVGYFNASVNEKLSDTIVLLNMRLVDLRSEDGNSRRGRVADFNDFLQDVVSRLISTSAGDSSREEPDIDNSDPTIPLTAIPAAEIAMLYPVAQIAGLLRSAQRIHHGERTGSSHETPTFLDFNHKSIVLKVLRAKLW